MDHLTFLLGFMTATMVAVTLHARRLGNERRDVTLLGVVSGLCGMGTLVSAIL